MALGAAGFDELKTQMLTLLPADGTPVLNRVMRVMLARKLERAIDDDEFFEVRDALLHEGLIGRLRGQGGQLFLAESKPAAIVSQSRDNTENWTEARLMKPLEKFLRGPFQKNLDLPPTGAFIVQDTSVIGGLTGRWARPDFILVTAMRFKIMPGAQIDLHSFELKTESGGNVLAIHEALAQTRFTHFGHFVWHLPDGSRFEPMLDDIVTHCEEHGVGLIRIRDPEKLETFEVLLDPRRKPTVHSVVDGFLETRLSPTQKTILMQAIRGGE